MNDLPEVGGRVHGVHAESVGDFPGGGGHTGIHPRQVDRNVGIVDGARIEEVVDQGEPIESSLVARAGSGLKRGPDGPQAVDVVDDPSRGMVELGGEPSLDVGPHLGAQAEQQTAAARGLQVPRADRHRERSARKRHRDVRPDPEPLGGERRFEEREERVVGDLERPDRVESDPLDPDRFRSGTGQANAFPHGCIEVHVRSSWVVAACRPRGVVSYRSLSAISHSWNDLRARCGGRCLIGRRSRSWRRVKRRP